MKSNNDENTLKYCNLINKFKKKSLKIKVVWLVLCIVLIGVVIIGGYKYNSINTYNNLITSANKAMDSGNYTNAIDLFTKSLKYKNDENVERSIVFAKKLEKLEDIYNQGLKLMNNKKYLDAIENFKKVTDDDKKLYAKAQDKIKESKNKFIAENMKLANDAYKNTKYDNANSYLDSILKIDSNNSDAKKLKSEIVQAQQIHTNTASTTNNTSSNTSFQQQWISDQIRNNGTSTDGNNNSQPDYSKQLLLVQLKNQEAELQKTLTELQNEKNVRLFKDGQWVWSADMKAVEATKDKLSEVQAEINVLQK